MKKIFFLALLVISVNMLVSAQAYEGTIEYDKKKQDAFMIDYPFSPDAVQNAIIAKMEKLGYKVKEEKGLFNKDKGFLVFKGAYITDISPNSMDYIVKVEQKSRKEKDQSTVYFIIQKDGLNAKAAFEATDVEKTKTFLGNLRPNIEAANLELQIKDQEDVVAKAEKKLKNLQGDKKDMEDKIKKLEDNIKNNINDQDNTQRDIDAQRKALDALKARRVSN